jgi:hypothetical protein
MPRVPATEAELSEIYIDESSQNKHTYLVIGGIIVKKACVARFNEKIAAARLPELPFGEMKWGKVSQSKLDAYNRVVNAFFDNDPTCAPLEYHCIVVHMPTINDRLYNQGSREIGFNKEIYQLCMKFGRLYKTRFFHVYADERRKSTPTEELRLILNRGIRKNGDARDWP